MPPSETAAASRLRRDCSSPVAFAWGLAEATVFFIVPDVWLTFVTTRGPRAGLRALLWAIAGALAGGLIMYYLGTRTPEQARALLVRVPAIRPALVTEVANQLDARGLESLLWAPMRGIPFKIFAVEWGARHGGIVALLAWSIPARGLRFLASVLAAAGALRAVAFWTGGKASRERALIGAFWIGLYTFYFAHFGW